MRNLLQWEAFTDALDRIDDEDSRMVLTWVRDLFGLQLIETHLAWYLITGRLSAQSRAAAVSSYIDRLCARLRPHAPDLVDAFARTSRTCARTDRLGCGARPPGGGRAVLPISQPAATPLRRSPSRSGESEAQGSSPQGLAWEYGAVTH